MIFHMDTCLTHIHKLPCVSLAYDVPFCVCVCCGQLCPTWRSHGLQLDSSVHGLFQARILEWAASSSSRTMFLPVSFTVMSICLRKANVIFLYNVISEGFTH